MAGLDFGSLIKFGYGAYRANEADAALNRMDDYKSYETAPEVAATSDEAWRRSVDPFSSRSDAAFEQMIDDFVGGSMGRSIDVDPSMSGVSNAMANNQALLARNRRAQAGDQLSAKYFTIAADMARTTQRTANQNVTDYNTRLFEEEQALGKAKSDAMGDTFEGLGSTLDQGSSLFGGGSSGAGFGDAQGPAGDYDGDSSLMDNFAGGGGFLGGLFG